ncbi:unnamed protein product [Brassica rapa subsp. narinosa]
MPCISTLICPERKFPLVKFDDNENWVANSDVIVGIIEEKVSGAFPEQRSRQ